MPTYDPHYNPIQPDDAAWNAEMARKEEERRARGTMPTTIVGPNGASPGKNIYGRTPEEEKAYREDLARRRGGATAQPASSAKPAASGTGDAFGDFRAQQQAENRRRIADGYRQAAQESAEGIRTTAREQKAARDAMRMNQNKAAFALWSALDGTPEGDEILDGSVDSFIRLYNEQMQGKGSSVTGYKKFMRRGADGKNEPFLRFTIKGADGTEHPKDYGRAELMEGLLRHGVPKEAFADGPAPKEEAKAAPADFNKDFFGSLNPAAKAAYANGKRDGFTEADFIQPNAAAPEAPKAPEDPFAAKRADERARKFRELTDSGMDAAEAEQKADVFARQAYPMPGAASAAPAVAAGDRGDSLSTLEQGSTPASAATGGEPPAAAPQSQKGAPEEFVQGKEYKPGDTVLFKGHPWKLGTKGWELADGKPPEKPAEKPAAAPTEGANPAPAASSASAPAPAAEGGPSDARAKAYDAIMALRNQFPEDERIRKATDDILKEYMDWTSESDARSADLRSRIDAGNAKTAAANERATASKERREKDEEFAKNYGRTPAELLNNIRGVLFRGQDMTAVQSQAGLGDFMQNLADARGRNAAMNGELDRAQRNDPNAEILQDGGATLPPGVKVVRLKKENVRTTVGKNGARDKHVTKNGEAERDRLRDLLEPALVPRTMLGANMRETKDAYEFYVTEKAFADLFNLQKKRFEST